MTVISGSIGSFFTLHSRRVCILNMESYLGRPGLPVITMALEMFKRGMTCNMSSKLKVIRIGYSISRRQSKVSHQNGDGKQYRTSANGIVIEASSLSKERQSDVLYPKIFHDHGGEFPRSKRPWRKVGTWRT